MAAALTSEDQKDERFFLFSDIKPKQEVVKKVDKFGPPPKNFIKQNKKELEKMQAEILKEVKKLKKRERAKAKASKKWKG